MFRTSNQRIALVATILVGILFTIYAILFGVLGSLAILLSAAVIVGAIFGAIYWTTLGE